MEQEEYAMNDRERAVVYGIELFGAIPEMAHITITRIIPDKPPQRQKPKENTTRPIALVLLAAATALGFAIGSGG